MIGGSFVQEEKFKRLILKERYLKEMVMRKKKNGTYWGKKSIIWIEKGKKVIEHHRVPVKTSKSIN